MPTVDGRKFNEDSEAVRAENDEKKKSDFLKQLEEWYRTRGLPMTIPACTQRKIFPSPVPLELPERDNRFAVKQQRVFICDHCGAEVRFSSKKNNSKYQRIDCEFAGSYLKHDWTDIPGALQWKAWPLRLIDATWHCADVCGANVTGKDSGKRLKRTEAPRTARNRMYILVSYQPSG